MLFLVLAAACGRSDFWDIAGQSALIQGHDAGPVADAGLGTDAGALCQDPTLGNYAPTEACWTACCVLACKKDCFGYPNESQTCDQFCETNAVCTPPDATHTACCPLNGECHGYI